MAIDFMYYAIGSFFSYSSERFKVFYVTVNFKFYGFLILPAVYITTIDLVYKIYTIKGRRRGISCGTCKIATDG